MSSGALIIGSADAVAAAAMSHAGLTDECVGAVVVGGGEIDLPVTFRCADWRLLEFASLPGDEVLLAEMPPAPVARLLLEQAVDCTKKVSILDAGKPRPLRLDDLLHSPVEKIDADRIAKAISGKRILITGGGGSIGSELACKIWAYEPQSLSLLDSSEYNLFTVGLELRDANLILADVRDVASIRRWVEREKPEIVFHAAALKQVPMAELFPCEALMTNVHGLRAVAEAAHSVGAHVIFVSTDKAVDPTGFMGATKRLGELYCRALDRRGPGRAIAVRLGNVLGSAGSVAPVFDAQLRARAPLTVTDPRVTRFFMSIPQAADALLQAGISGLDPESARGIVRAIDMGDPIPVVQLAHDMARLQGLRPGVDVSTVFTGMRPGERLHEQMIGSDEWREATDTLGVIAVAARSHPLGELTQTMDRLVDLARLGADGEAVAGLFAVTAPRSNVTPFSPASAGTATEQTRRALTG